MTWISWARWHPGPADKVYMEPNRHEGVVVHSVEGWLTGAFSELARPDRKASWHFTVALDGTLYQHFSLDAACWASGNREANTRYVAVEAEGVQDSPLTEAQKRTLNRLFDEIEDGWGIEISRAAGTLLKHNEVATKWQPHSGGTQCPSARYERFFAERAGTKMKEPQMTKDEVLALLAEERRRWEAEAGASYKEFVKGVTGRLDEAHDLLWKNSNWNDWRAEMLANGVWNIDRNPPQYDPNP